MKLAARHRRAFVLLELVLLLLLVLLLIGLIDFGVSRSSKAKAQRVMCMNNLHIIGTSLFLFAQDHNGLFPNQAAAMEGEGTTNTVRDVIRGFQVVLTNQSMNPHVLICPLDSRVPAKDFASLSTANLSYFVCLNANTNLPTMFLMGDRKLANKSGALQTGVFELKTNASIRWASGTHYQRGNIALIDGTVESTSSDKLALLNQQAPTNHTLWIP